MKKLLVTFAACIVLTGCSPLEQNARNTAAALQGIIVAAQSEYQTSCASTPGLAVCQDINRGISAQNALVTAVEAYCSWNTVSPPTDPNAVCVPVKTSQQALQTAIANATAEITAIKGIIK